MGGNILSANTLNDNFCGLSFAMYFRKVMLDFTSIGQTMQLKINLRICFGPWKNNGSIMHQTTAIFDYYVYVVKTKCCLIMRKDCERVKNRKFHSHYIYNKFKTRQYRPFPDLCQRVFINAIVELNNAHLCLPS